MPIPDRPRDPRDCLFIGEDPEATEALGRAIAASRRREAEAKVIVDAEFLRAIEAWRREHRIG